MSLAWGVMAVSVLVSLGLAVWVPRVQAGPVPEAIPDPAHAAAVLTPDRTGDRREVPRPLVVALIGLRAAGAVDTVRPDPGTRGPGRPLRLVATGDAPAGISGLGRVVHAVLAHATTRAQGSGPGGTTAIELSRSPEIVAELDRMRSRLESQGLVRSRRRILVGRRGMRVTWWSLGTAALGWAVTGLRRPVTGHRLDLGTELSPALAGGLVAIAGLLFLQYRAGRRLRRLSPTTPAGWTAVRRLQQVHACLRPVDPVWRKVSDAPAGPGPAGGEAATCHWMTPRGWAGYRPEQAEWAEALFCLEFRPEFRLESCPEFRVGRDAPGVDPTAPTGGPSHPGTPRRACPAAGPDPWTWRSAGLACDPWFCLDSGLYQVEHGVPGVSSVLRRVAAGGPGGHPGVPAGAFAVLDLPAHVPLPDLA